jgi:DNA adenine methylase
MLVSKDASAKKRVFIDLGAHGKYTITLEEWSLLYEILSKTNDPRRIAVLEKLPENLKGVFLAMYRLSIVKYDAEKMCWKIDYSKLKLYGMKRTEGSPLLAEKKDKDNIKEKEELLPIVEDMLAEKILKHVLELHGEGKPTKPIGYPGGDWFIKDEILDVLVKSNCDTLVEVFGGSGVISMYAPRDIFKKIIYNDIDPLLVNFFTVLKEKPAELSRKIALIPVSRETTNKYIEMLKTGEIHKLDPVEKAAVYFYLVRTTMFSKLDQFSPRASSNVAIRIRRHAALIPEYAKMWRDISIENMDFRNLIKKYDGENTAFYCDPPFLSTGGLKRDDYYRFAFTDKDMMDLLNTLSGIKGKFTLKSPEDHLEIRYIREWIEKNSYRVKTIKHAKSMMKVIGEKRPVQKTILVSNF